jgi:hypothetical protein
MALIVGSGGSRYSSTIANRGNNLGGPKKHGTIQRGSYPRITNASSMYRAPQSLVTQNIFSESKLNVVQFRLHGIK